MEQYLANANPVLLLLSALWVLPWKGIALWQASRRSNKFWFILILIVNTFGILEILYIFVLKDVDWSKYRAYFQNKVKSPEGAPKKSSKKKS